MKTAIKKIIIFAFTASIWAMPVLSFGQTEAKNEKLLQGTWVLESVTAFDESMQIIPVNADSISYCEIPTEIDIQQDEVTFVRKSGTSKAKYKDVVRKNSLRFPAYAGWEIVDNKLQLQWGEDLTGQAPKMRTVVLTYKLK